MRDMMPKPKPSIEPITQQESRNPVYRAFGHGFVVGLLFGSSAATIVWYAIGVM